MSRSSLETNTGHRFISKGKTAFKLHIHTPDDTVLHRSVGFVRLGEEMGLKKAIARRNELGLELWGKHWNRILKEPYLFTRLPHSLEPSVVHKPSSSDPDGKKIPYYLAKWSVFDEYGNRTYKTALANIEKLGKLAAYNKAKRILIDAHKDDLDILSWMGRFNVIKHK